VTKKIESTKPHESGEKHWEWGWMAGFPCSHLCLCLSCAEDFLQSLNGPGFQELANQRMAPQEERA